MTARWAEAEASPERAPSHSMWIRQAGHVGAGSQVQTSAQVPRQDLSNCLLTNPDLTILKHSQFKGKQ